MLKPSFCMEGNVTNQAGNRILLKKTERHAHDSHGALSVNSDRLVNGRVSGISHERLLTRIELTPSIFTAASGMHRLSSSKVNEKLSSGTIEMDDVCIDNSSEDSLGGALHMDGITPGESDVSDITHSDSLNNSHWRLRNALLTSSTQLPNQQATVRSNLYGATDNALSISIPMSQPTSPHHLDDQSSSSRRVDTVPPSEFRSLPFPEALLHKQLSTIKEGSQTFDTSSALPPSSIARPPSASSFVLRRLSTDSCFDHRSAAFSKSMSQPQSPEIPPRRASLPVSPCRLPMKKRKLNWSQLDSDPVSTTSNDRKQPTSAPCSSFDFSFSNLPRTPTTVNSVGPPTLFSPSRPSPSSFSIHSSPLIIDCPPPAGLPRPDSKSQIVVENTSAVGLPSSIASDDRRPRSIPAPLVSPNALTDDQLKKLERAVSTSICNIPQHGVDVLDNGHVLTSNLKNKTRCSKRPSLLIRSLSATPNTSQTKSISDLSDSLITQSFSGISKSPSGSALDRQPQLSSLQSRLNNGSGSASLFHRSVSIDHTDRNLSIGQSTAIHDQARFVHHFLDKVNTPQNHEESNSNSISVDLAADLIRNWLGTSGSRESNTVQMTLSNGMREQSAAHPKLLHSDRPTKKTSTDMENGAAQIIMMLSPSSLSPQLDAVESSVATTSCDGNRPGNPISNFSKKTNFPLFLVSASSSAGAAALAAATARATGAPPSSLVPVPVQITTYVPSSKVAPKTGAAQSTVGASDPSSSTAKSDVPSALHSQEQRFLISLCAPPTVNRRSSDPTVVERNTSMSFGSPLDNNNNNLFSGTATLSLSVGAKGTGALTLPPTPAAVAHPSA